MALREILARFGFQVDDAGLKKGEKSVSGFTAKIQAAAGIYGGAQILGAVHGFFNELTALEGQINDQSESLGLSAREFQQWGYAATQSGATAEVVTAAMLKMQRAAVDNGGKFRELGVDVLDSSGKMKGTSDLFRETGLAIGGISNEAERTAAIMDIFGRSGTKLQATFAGGAEGLDAMNQRFEDLGGGLGKDALDVLSDAGDRSADLGLAVTGLKARLAVALFPALTEIVTKGAKVAASFGKMAEGGKVFQATAIVVAAAVGRAGLKMLAPYLPLIAALAVAVVLLDDILVTISGGDSAIRRFVDGIFGIGETEAIVKAAKENFASLWKEIGKAPDLAGKIEAALSLIGADIVKFFADDLGEAWDVFSASEPKMAAKASSIAGAVATALVPWKVIADMDEWQRVVIAKLKTAGAEWAAEARQIGKAVVDGIVEGLSDLTGIDLGTAKVGTALKKGLRGKKGVDAHSPSRMSAAVSHDVLAGLERPLHAALPRLEALGAMLGAATIPNAPARAVSMMQTNTIAINQYGVRDPRAATRAGVLDGLGDDRRALLGAIG